MKDFLLLLVKNIVTNPKDVAVSEKTDTTGSILLELKVNPDDIGLVIGKGGKVIKSLRNLVKVKAIFEKKRVSIVLLEE